MDGACHAVGFQRPLHRRRRRDHGRDAVAFLARDHPRRRREPGLGQEREIVVEIFLEQGVVGLDARQAVLSGPAHAGAVGEKRRVDVHEVEVRRIQAIQCGGQRAQMHQPVFRIARHLPAGHTHDIGRRLRPGVVGRHQHARMPRRGQCMAQGLDRSGYAIDAWEIHVGHHQDTHGRLRQGRSLRCMAVRLHPDYRSMPACAFTPSRKACFTSAISDTVSASSTSAAGAARPVTATCCIAGRCASASSTRSLSR